MNKRYIVKRDSKNRWYIWDTLNERIISGNLVSKKDALAIVKVLPTTDPVKQEEQKKKPMTNHERVVALRQKREFIKALSEKRKTQTKPNRSLSDFFKGIGR
jgi:hypothetical protein